ncbi:hypothetical protein ACQ27_gp462 [Klebsiella phage K64-1]|nr:hypothetical protein ACQ27_gp462 [Klebsiella phage K64-1]
MYMPIIIPLAVLLIAAVICEQYHLLGM